VLTKLPERDSVYRAAKADFETIVGRLSEAIPQHVDDTIPELPNKDLVGSHFFSFVFEHSGERRGR
jgi:hypothetical protein